MKRILLLFIHIAIVSQAVHAQNVAINSTGAAPAASSMLDITATDKGLLIPRVALTATNAAGPVTSPATSLLVYNTATAGAAPNNVVPGYYYWNGTAWVSLLTSATATTTSWGLGGNTLSSMQSFGTLSNHDVPFVTNNTEKMRLFTGGSLGLGATSLDATNPEKFLVNAGTTSSYNLINAKGSINNYLQMNIQNQSNGTAASSDIVATANDGTETLHFVDLGINSSGYSATGVLGGAHNAYLYSTGNNFVIGNATANMDLLFFTGGTNVANERMRITGLGRVGIGNTAPTEVLDVTGNLKLTGAFMPGNAAGTSGYVLTSAGAGASPTWTNPTTLFGTSAWTLDGNSVASARKFGTITNFDVPFITNNVERMRLFTTGGVAIGATSLAASNPEKLLVSAGTTTSYNLINAKGSINNYLQLNIQNQSSGTAASSDIVATANNGTETINFVDMGINSSGYTTTGVLGGVNNAYLYSTGNDFVIGNATATRDLIFFTNGTAAADEKMRVTAEGNVGIGTSDFDVDSPQKLLVDAAETNTAISAIGEINDYLEINVQNSSNGNRASSDLVATANNGTENSVYVDMGINSAGYANVASNILNGGNLAYLYANANDFKIGNGTPGRHLIFFTNPTGGTLGTNTANGEERVRITEAGNVGVATTTPNSTLSVNGSITVAYRVINGAGTLGATDHVVLHTGSSNATWNLPAASTCAGRIYRLVNQGTTNITLSESVTTANGTTTTTLPFGTTGNYEILSDGTVWRKIN